ncbi:ribonuclease H-like domain-containing protein [Tanacetum coccineum]
MCDKKNNILFTETECFVLSPDFKLLDESQVLLRVPRQSNMYNFDLKNVVPSGDLTCLFAKATIDESTLWHRRLGHMNFKTMNKLVKGNLVRGLLQRFLTMTILVLLVRRESNTRLPIHEFPGGGNGAHPPSPSAREVVYLSDDDLVNNQLPRLHATSDIPSTSTSQPPVSVSPVQPLAPLPPQPFPVPPPPPARSASPQPPTPQPHLSHISHQLPQRSLNDNLNVLMDNVARRINIMNTPEFPVGGNAAQTSSATEVVCLSDDE